MRNVRRPKSFWGERILYYTVRVCASSLHTEGRKTFLRMVSGFTASEGWASAGRLWTLAVEVSGFPDARDTENRQKARNGRQAGLVPRVATASNS